MPQPLLHAGEECFLVTRFDEDHPVRRKPRLCKRRRKQVLASDTPEHLAARARRNPGGEQGGRCPMNRSVSAAGHLMQGAKRQPPSRKPLVDLRQPERQDLSRAARPSFEALNALPKLDDGTGDAIRHLEKGCSSGLCKGFLRWYVLYLFSIAS